MEENAGFSQDCSDDSKLEALEEFLCDKNGIVDPDSCDESVVKENLDVLLSTNYKDNIDLDNNAKTEKTDTSLHFAEEKMACDNVLISCGSPNTLGTDNTLIPPNEQLLVEKSSYKADDFTGGVESHEEHFKNNIKPSIEPPLDDLAAGSTNIKIISEKNVNADLEINTFESFRKSPLSEEIPEMKESLITEPVQNMECITSAHNDLETASEILIASDETLSITNAQNNELGETTDTTLFSSSDNKHDENDSEKSEEVLEAPSFHLHDTTSIDKDIVEPLDVRESKDDSISDEKNTFQLSEDKQKLESIEATCSETGNTENIENESTPEMMLNEVAQKVFNTFASDSMDFENENLDISEKIVNEASSGQGALLCNANTENINNENPIDIEPMDFESEEKKETEDNSFDEKSENTQNILSKSTDITVDLLNFQTNSPFESYGDDSRSQLNLDHANADGMAMDSSPGAIQDIVAENEFSPSESIGIEETETDKSAEQGTDTTKESHSDLMHEIAIEESIEREKTADHGINITKKPEHDIVVRKESLTTVSIDIEGLARTKRLSEGTECQNEPLSNNEISIASMDIDESTETARSEDQGIESQNEKMFNTEFERSFISMDIEESTETEGSEDQGIESQNEPMSNTETESFVSIDIEESTETERSEVQGAVSKNEPILNSEAERPIVSIEIERPEDQGIESQNEPMSSNETERTEDQGNESRNERLSSTDRSLAECSSVVESSKLDDRLPMQAEIPSEPSKRDEMSSTPMVSEHSETNVESDELNLTKRISEPTSTISVESENEDVTAPQLHESKSPVMEIDDPHEEISEATEVSIEKVTENQVIIEETESGKDNDTQMLLSAAAISPFPPSTESENQITPNDRENKSIDDRSTNNTVSNQNKATSSDATRSVAINSDCDAVQEKETEDVATSTIEAGDESIDIDNNVLSGTSMEVVEVIEEGSTSLSSNRRTEDAVQIIVDKVSEVEVIELTNEEKTTESQANQDQFSKFKKPNAAIDSGKIKVRSEKSCSTTSLDEPIEEVGKRGRGRPKRTAARAADSKIKTLVLRSLEPSAVDEVSDPMTQQCAQCKRTKLCRFVVGDSGLCSENCHSLYLRAQADIGERLCQECHGSMSAPVTFSWETMDFCKEECLAQYQVALGMNCVNCGQAVQNACMGKYCVRFGNAIKQFCAPTCLEEHKKGLKVCSYCQKDISKGAEGFLAPVGNKGQFKEFCTKDCMTKYTSIGGTVEQNINPCGVCGEMKPVAIEVLQGSKLHTLCSEPCFAAFKFVNSVSDGPCHQCKKYFDKVNLDKLNIYVDDRLVTFCCKTCLNGYVLSNRKIMQCSWCKVKKYNFDMIKKAGPEGISMMCSLTCLKSFEETSGSRRNVCDLCGIYSVAEYKTPSASGMRHFCSYKCAITFKGSKGPGIKSVTQQIENVSEVAEKVVQTAPPTPEIYQHIVTKPTKPVEVRNKSILCKPYMHNKGTSCRPLPCPKSTQTDSSLNLQTLVPIPVPIFIPAPACMYSAPYPVPIPFPLPIPVPIFIPTTRNSAKGIMKEIKKIQEKIPNDPFEAELLMMAEMVAGEKKQEVTDSESDGDGNDGHDAGDAGEPPESFSPEAVDTNAFGEDMLQMALKMASELDEPAVDMESVLTSNTITPSAQPTVDSKALFGIVPVNEETAQQLALMRGRKRIMRGGRGGSTIAKRGRRSSGASESSVLPSMASMPPTEMAQPQRIEIEKPDALMRLKYTFGVNAWRHWVMQKNLELEKAMLTNRKIKPFKPDLLQLTADELNFSLCLFVKEVKKPNGQEYAPDTIYYLCLGIQQYLFENGRIDNIFTDTYYEKFTDCLDDVAKKFAIIYGDSQYIVTRVEEEHLWESKQLGAHSPHVLLSTLMFFNTKHFNLVTVEEHMQLSFSHIMKHWKRNPNAPGIAKVPGSRNVLLRFYPPQSALEANSRKKKVYEQQENEENPLRCPVKLYEFYLSKCPESVKTRNDVFYLLPERSCVPDSPVWYSTMALGKDPLMKMLHRVKMVKEINIALLSP